MIVELRELVELRSDGTLWSNAFGDPYFHPAGGADEGRLVFLEGNHLADRWQALRSSETFTLVETGFGTGLNFLLACELWEQLAPAGSLRYVAVEGFPLAQPLFEEFWARFPEPALRAAGTGLAQTWPRANIGQPGAAGTGLAQTWPRATAPTSVAIQHSPAIRLELLLTPLATALPQLPEQVDAWFLDGFAPSRNPEMWSPELFARMGESTIRPGCRTSAGSGAGPTSDGATVGTAATWASAGLVKQGLRKNGFRVERKPGFGGKHHRLEAVRIAEAE
jgi:tRNA 5-methylaminomethyl-2-thiouridine biosynthesis bifunctional protein